MIHPSKRWDVPKHHWLQPWERGWVSQAWPLQPAAFTQESHDIPGGSWRNSPELVQSRGRAASCKGIWEQLYSALHSPAAGGDPSACSLRASWSPCLDSGPWFWFQSKYFSFHQHHWKDVGCFCLQGSKPAPWCWIN